MAKKKKKSKVKGLKKVTSLKKAKKASLLKKKSKKTNSKVKGVKKSALSSQSTKKSKSKGGVTQSKSKSKTLKSKTVGKKKEKSLKKVKKSSLKIKKALKSKKILKAKKVKVKKEKGSPKKAVSKKVLSKKSKKIPKALLNQQQIQEGIKPLKKRGRKPKKHLDRLLALSKQKTGRENEVFLTDAEGRRYCRVSDCDQLALVMGHCRFHYLLFWKKIQMKKKILSEGKLKKYIEELGSQYPDKLLQMISNDLSSEKKFLQAIQELELDEPEGTGKFKKTFQTFTDETPQSASNESYTTTDDNF